MIYVSRELPLLYRDRMLTWLNGGIGSSKYADNREGFIINFYSGTIPADISSTVTRTAPVLGTFNSTHNGHDFAGSVTSTGIASATNVLLAQITDCSFLNLQPDGDQWISLQLPFVIEYVAAGTIGFYEIIFSGQAASHIADTPAGKIVGATYDQIGVSAADVYTDNDLYNISPKSAFYGTIGLLSSGAEIVLDRLDITTESIPFLYELGFNPQITV